MRKERMIIPLSQLKSNPERDFKVDPLDQAAVEALVTSITEDGFWGGVTARPSAIGGYEIAAGHHRVEAARRAGLTEAEIFVGDFDDQTMVRIYSKENALQRNNKATSIDGAVLAAVRYLTRVLMDGIYGDFTTDGLFESEKAFDVARGTLLRGDGIGRKLILRVLGDTPGMTENCIKDSLSRLKASGNYARTLAAIHRQLEDEAEAARLQVERLEQEAQAAVVRGESAKTLEVGEKKAHAVIVHRTKKKAVETSGEVVKNALQQKITFDLTGVSVYLVNPNQLTAFKKLAECYSQYLPVENQAALAQALKEEAARQNTELSASFIHQHFMRLLMDVKQKERTFASKAAKAAFEAKSQQEKDKAIQENIAHNLRSALAGFVKLRESRKKAPATIAFTYASVLRNAVVAVADEIVKFNEEFS